MKLKLHEEAGITSDSLSNAQELVRAYGRPLRLEFVSQTKGPDWGYFVTAVWDQPASVAHKFSGFAWGYGGTGPRGLDEFLELVGAPGGLDSTTVPIRNGATDFIVNLHPPVADC